MRSQLGLSVHEFTFKIKPGIEIIVGQMLNNYIRNSYPVDMNPGKLAIII